MATDTELVEPEVTAAQMELTESSEVALERGLPTLKGQSEGPQGPWRLEQLEGEIRECEQEIERADHRARQAISEENAEEAAAAWQRKRSASGQLSELMAQQEQLRRQIQSRLEQGLLGLKHQYDAMLSDLLREQQELMLETAHLAGRLTRTVERLAEMPEKWNGLQEKWRGSMDSVIRGAEPLLSSSVAAPERRPEAPQPWVPPRPPDAEVRRTSWSVYNVDTGRMVETLPELKQILARWLPLVPSEEERLRRFLALYDTGPMPEKLRQELRELGFPVGS